MESPMFTYWIFKPKFCRMLALTKTFHKRNLLPQMLLLLYLLVTAAATTATATATATIAIVTNATVTT
jgi:hypothetical protein